MGQSTKYHIQTRKHEDTYLDHCSSLSRRVPLTQRYGVVCRRCLVLVGLAVGASIDNLASTAAACEKTLASSRRQQQRQKRPEHRGGDQPGGQPGGGSWAYDGEDCAGGVDSGGREAGDDSQ